MAWTKQLFLVARKVDAELQQTSEYYKVLLAKPPQISKNKLSQEVHVVVKDDDIIGGE
jgi:hypothetical protein